MPGDHPEIELISGVPAFKALETVLIKVDGEVARLFARRTVDRTGASQAWSSAPDGFVPQELQHILDRNATTQFREIDARHERWRDFLCHRPAPTAELAVWARYARYERP